MPWKQVLMFLLGLQSFQACFAISQDESARSYLERFNTTRNNHVTPALKTAARDFIVKTFQDFGLDTWTEEFASNQKNFPGINIIGRVNGRYTGTSKDKILIIATHYDTVQGTNGVDDNGSGMTALLQALRQYKSSNYMKCSQNYTLLFVAFDLEEVQQSCQAAPCPCKRGLQWRIQGFSKRGPDRGIDCYDVILTSYDVKVLIVSLLLPTI
ncbi:uncharacterized protein LOC116302924 [Actinia tenebrosa]|uniref:Uncharacterized protein LOC116302924 n=1 Tax=Actinia tenebrosa TaxID=6105 RepID=A0A6P8IMF7_ACTTE|nr:uncharacterized protein LOC116302924 [Actinia tenebrosa]